MAPGTFQVKGQVTDHGIGRGQVFAEVGEQGFGVDAMGDGEQLAGIGLGFAGFGLEVEVEDAVGGFVERFCVGWIGVRWVGVTLNIDEAPML